MPEIINEITNEDYHDYFESVTKSWIDELTDKGHEFKHHKIFITAGPWRTYAVHWHGENGILTLDFYSTTRMQGGPTFPEDLAKDM